MQLVVLFLPLNFELMSFLYFDKILISVFLDWLERRLVVQ